MSPKLSKIFVCEFITAGGLLGEPLPHSLVHEGSMMRDALLADLMQLNQYDLITLHDPRVGAPHLVANSLAVEKDFERTFISRANEADLIWLVAPETDGILSKLTQYCMHSNAVLIGCGLDSVSIAGNKLQCADSLLNANVSSTPVIPGTQWLAHISEQCSPVCDAWVAKPVDGVGCEGIHYFNQVAEVSDWLRDRDHQQYLLQLYIDGISASFSMFCNDGQAWLLSCNKQEITIKDNAFKLLGITVNAEVVMHYWDDLANIATNIARMLPDAKGYVGVDVMIDTVHDKISVLEINPRLTTSYVGLSQATALNVAGLIIDCIINPTTFTMPKIETNTVNIKVPLVSQ